MSLIKIQVDADDMLNRHFTEIEQKNLPFAVMQAVNATAFGVREAWKKEAPRVFDNPVPLTVNAAQYRKATKNKLYAEVFLRDEATNGTAPAKYLLPQVEGGTRRKKGLEVLLQAKGVMPAGMFAVPGKGAQLDANGNIQKGQINKILSQLGARNDALQNETDTSRDRRRKRAAKKGERGGEFFAIQKPRGRMLPGIYERLRTGFGSGVRSLLIFVNRTSYTPRYNIFAYAQRTWDKLMPFHFQRELEKAVQTSKFRGKS
jgi:hypothetical protein